MTVDQYRSHYATHSKEELVEAVVRLHVINEAQAKRLQSSTGTEDTTPRNLQRPTGES